MRFFEDFKEVSNQDSIGITNLLSNITTREGSHKGGWARLLKCQLENLGQVSVKILDNTDKLENFDVIIFDLGAEYSGALNLFGGLDEKVFNRLNELKDFKGRLYSWRNDLPDVSVLNGRRTNQSTCDAFKQAPETFLQEVKNILDKCQTFQHAYRTDGLLIGDSHTPSVWTPDLMIERRDGRTLGGMIEHNTIKKYVDKFKESGIDIKKLHVHCSSIDIRHHICRLPGSEEILVRACMNLIDQISQLNIPNVVINHTMGIEDESRELPKTGYYKGTPFFGSWEQRNKHRQIFNTFFDEVSKELNWSTLSFPNYFFDESGKLKFEIMEKPQSVHVSPEHYRTNLSTGASRW